MDTWATSSLTPQIVAGWVDDPDLFERVFPMDMRPQAHEIIRTWLFSTRRARHYRARRACRGHDAAISGLVLDPDRKKLSKSKGNSVDDPNNLLDTFGADAVRYWAAQRPPRHGHRLRREPDEGRPSPRHQAAQRVASSCSGSPRTTSETRRSPNPLDRAMLAGLADVVDEATAAFEAYDYARALERTETFFWAFCDDYVELVKGRAYGAAGAEGAASANTALRLALSTLLRLFAPFLPFVTEEVWSWWQGGSIHRAPWPDASDVRAAAGDGDRRVAEVTGEVLGAVRKAKSEAQRSMRAPVERVVVRDTPERIAALQLALDDLKEAGSVREVVLVQSDGASDVEVALADDAA